MKLLYQSLAIALSIVVAAIGVAGGHPYLAFLLFSIAIVGFAESIFNSRFLRIRLREGMLRFIGGFLMTVVLSAVALVYLRPQFQQKLRVMEPSPKATNLSLDRKAEPSQPPLPKTNTNHKDERRKGASSPKGYCDPMETCDTPTICKWATEMANGIDALYQRYTADRQSVISRYLNLSTNDQNNEAHREAEFSIATITDMELNDYRSRYRSNARKLRAILEQRIGPSVHDERQDALYDIHDKETTRTPDGHTVFVWNLEIENLPRIANDLRTLASRAMQPQSGQNQRPWIGVVAFGLLTFAENDDYRVRLQVKNSANVPAFNVWYWNKSRLASVNDMQPLRSNMDDGKKHDQLGSIPPQADRIVTLSWKWNEWRNNFPAVISGQASIANYGEFVYLDSQGLEHRTQFCFHMKDGGTPNQRLVLCETFNELN